MAARSATGRETSVKVSPLQGPRWNRLWGLEGVLQSHAACAISAHRRRRSRRGCGCSSGVEHNLAKVGVEGSNPFARSIFHARKLERYCRAAKPALRFCCFSRGFLRKAAEPRDSREVSEANVATLACLRAPMAPTHDPPPLRGQPSGARSELCPFLSSQQYSGGGRRDLKRA